MLTKEELLKKLANKYDDWLRMAKSFDISDDEASEIVQEMFIRIFDYVKEPHKIMYNKDEVNTFYIYITLRNLYYANIHNGTKKDSRIVYTDEITDYNLNRVLENSYDSIEEKEKLEALFERVEQVVDEWYWYDKGIFNLYYKTDMSMRDISKETKISLSSIFNTIKNAKVIIKENLYDEYKKAKKRD